MNEELEAFKDALREAGQPWSRNGVRIVGAGVLGLLISQLAPWRMVVLIALLGSFVMIMVGWVFLVIAFVKRRQWAKAHPLREPPLPDHGLL